jgi:hypothetical protein
VDERTGVVRLAISLARTPVSLALAAQAGQLVVVAADMTDPTMGRGALLDATTGGLSGSRPVISAPLAVALAGHGGRVVVAAGPALAPGPGPWWQPWVPRSLGRWLPRLAPQPSARRFVAGTLSLVDVGQP